MPVPTTAPSDLLFALPLATDANLLFGADTAQGAAPSRFDLLFASAPAKNANLLFGPDATQGAATVTADLLGTLPGLVVQALVRQVVGLQLGAALPALLCDASVVYASGTQRPTVGRTSHPWQVARAARGGAAQRQQVAAAAPVGWQTSWQRAIESPHVLEHRLPQVLLAAPVQRLITQQQALRMQGATGFAHQGAMPIVQMRTGVFQDASRLHDATRFAHQDGDHLQRARRITFWQNAQALTQRWVAGFAVARAAPRGRAGRYQEAVPPPPGRSVRPVAPPAAWPCPNGPYLPGAGLLFAALAPAAPALVFACEGVVLAPPVVSARVPIRRVYFVINDVSLHRASDGAPVPLYALSLSLDASSWAWGDSCQEICRV